MSLSPQRISELHRQAQGALRKGRLAEAHQHCLQILEADRNHADAWFICGVIAARNARFEQAVDILRNACMLDQHRAEYQAELGKYLLALDLPSKALDAAGKGLALAPGDVPTLSTLGGVFSHCGDHDRALRCYEAALASVDAAATPAKYKPANLSGLHFNMAVSLQFIGEVDRSEEAFEQAIKLQPEFFKAHAALSTLKRHTEQHNHLPRLEALRAKASSAVDRLQLGHAIAREQEDLGRFSDSLHSLAWAKELRCAEIGFDIRREIDLFEQLQAVFPAPAAEAPPQQGCDSGEPVFIVGMPRTGTTLVEQILGSHSQVFAAGELQQFPQLIKRRAARKADSELEIAIAGAAIDPAGIGQEYIDSTRPLTGHTPRFTDKLPRNYLYLGSIHRALPNAKIICLRRDPMDTCLSNYRQLFAVNARYYHYNLDLMHCGHYFMAFDRLINHWQKVMPGQIHLLSYEALVQNPEPEIRALLNFCELEWEEDCLSFHRRDNAVATPSALQVKQGIYTSSVQRWKQYGEALQPLYALLQESGYYN